MSYQTRFQGRLLRLDTQTVEGSGEREVVWHPDCVCAAVFTLERQWVFVRQYRVAAQSVLLEVPGGLVDPGEDPDQAIERELREEIGYRFGRIRRLLDMAPSPGYCRWRMVGYLADQADLGESDPDSGEFLELVRVPAEEGLRMALDGRIADGLSVATLLAAARVLQI